MQAANRRDQLVGTIERLNSLLDLDAGTDEGNTRDEEPPGRVARSKGGKTGKSGVSDIFSRAARDVFRRIHSMSAGVLGIINPSDGRPQQEHCPDWAWFRPISFNRQSWIDTWPELQV